jgi:hypothetical protein
MSDNIFKNNKGKDIRPCEALVQYIEKYWSLPWESSMSSTEAYIANVNALHKLCVLEKQIKDDSHYSYTYDDLFKRNERFK